MKFKAFFMRVIDAVRGFRPSRRFARNFGYTTLFSVLFSVFLVWSIPLNRFVPRLESMASGVLNRTVRIGEISTTFMGALSLSNVEIGLGQRQEDETAEGGRDDSETQASAGQEAESSSGSDTDGDEVKKPKTKIEPMYLFDNLTVNVGFLSMLLGKLSFDVDVTGLGGTMAFSYKGAMPGKSASDGEEDSSVGESSKSLKHLSKSSRAKRRAMKASKGESEEALLENEEESTDDEEKKGEASDAPVSVSLNLADINLKSVLDLKSILPVPVDGTLNLSVDLSSPAEGFSQASGKISFSIDNLILSRKGYEAEIFGTSLMVPPLVVSSIKGEMVFENGVGKVTEFKVDSKHIDMNLKGKITLGRGLKESENDLYAMFKVEDSYLTQSDSIRTIVDSLDSFSSKARLAHRDDGFYGFKYEGAFGKGRFTPAKEYSSDDDEKKVAKSSKDKKRKRRAPRSSKTRMNSPGLDDMQQGDETASAADANAVPTMASPSVNTPSFNTPSFNTPSFNTPPPRSYEPSPPQQQPIAEPPPPPSFVPPTRPEPPQPDQEQAENAPPEEAQATAVEPPPEEVPPPPQEEEAPVEQPPEEETPPPEVQEEPAEEAPPPPPRVVIDPDEVY